MAGGKALKLERLIARYEARLYLMGHTHDTVVLSRRRVRLGVKNRLEDCDVRAVNTGSFLRSVVDGQQMYAEEKGLQPLPVGCPEINVDCETQEMTVSV